MANGRGEMFVEVERRKVAVRAQVVIWYAVTESLSSVLARLYHLKKRRGPVEQSSLFELVIKVTACSRGGKGKQSRPDGRSSKSDFVGTRFLVTVHFSIHNPVSRSSRNWEEAGRKDLAPVGM